MIRAIVFDLGGVLIDLDFDDCVRAFREILGYERITEILDLSHQKGIYGDMEAGLISEDVFRAEVLKDSRPGCVPADVDRAMACLLTGMDPNEISTARMHEIYEENGLDWRRVFRKEFLSCRMKLMKPGREIFDAVAAEIGVPPAEILFVDDSQKNVDGARAAGWQAALYVQCMCRARTSVRVSQIICNFEACRCTVTSGSASLLRRRCPPKRWMKNTSGSGPRRSGASRRPTSSTMCAG